MESRRREKRFYKWTIAQLIFLLTSISFVNLYLLTTTKEAEAAVNVLDVEILSNLTSANTSGTSVSAPWPSSVTNRPVTFSIKGNGGLNASVNVNGEDKFALLAIPTELRTSISANGSAAIKTSTTVNIANVPLLNAILTALDSLTSSLNLNLGIVQIDLTAVNQQISLLKTVGNLGNVEISSPLQFTTQREALYANMSSNLGVVLGTNVPQILRNLSTAIQNTQIRVIGIDIGGVVRALLQGLLNTLLSTVTSALNNLATVQEQMADAAVLGATDVQIPTLLSGPGQLTANWTANFSASVLKAKPTDINLLNFSALNISSRQTMIYFMVEALTMDRTNLPTQLNFGRHAIQTKKSETWRATANGDQSAAATTGILRINDSRNRQKKWQVKVRQSTNWVNGTRTLPAAELRVQLGTVNSTFTDGRVVLPDNATIALQQNVEKNVVTLENAASTGGLTVNFSQFNLFVPEKTPKFQGQYRATVVWTVSDTP